MFSWFRFILLSHPLKTDLMKQSILSPAPMPIPNTAAAAAALGFEKRLCQSWHVSEGVVTFLILTIRYSFVRVRFP